MVTTRYIIHTQAEHETYLERWEADRAAVRKWLKDIQTKASKLDATGLVSTRLVYTRTYQSKQLELVVPEEHIDTVIAALEAWRAKHAAITVYPSPAAKEIASALGLSVEEAVAWADGDPR